MGPLGRCQVHGLRRNGELVAAVWFQSLSPIHVDLHAHATREVRGRWLTPSTLRYLARQARASGASYVTAYPRPEHFQYVQRLGFTTQHLGVPILKLYETPCLPTNYCTPSSAP